MNKRIHVVAAVIYDENRDYIFLARRPSSTHQGGKWEFPGGKVEPHETSQQALKRELQEELGISVTACSPLIKISHDYPDRQVLLNVWEVHQFSGTAHGNEGQMTRWVPRNQLENYDFPAANKPIIDAIELPSRYLITPDFTKTPDFLDKLEQSLKSGIRLICFRAKHAGSAEYVDMATQVIQRAKAYNAIVIVNSPPDHIEGAHGIHLTSLQLQQEPPSGGLFKNYFSASCHSLEEMQKAQHLGVKCLMLSPVQATQSHPETKPLGWDVFQQLADQAHLPVYALGGMDRADDTKARAHGGQGIAAISGLWGV